MSHIKVGKGGAIIANPNCSTIIALMAVTPLDRVANVKRMCVSTYQVSRGGNRWDVSSYDLRGAGASWPRDLAEGGYSVDAFGSCIRHTCPRPLTPYWEWTPSTG